MTPNIKVNVERHVLNQPTRKLKLDEQGRMQVKLADGSLVMVKPEDLFSQEDIKVVHSLEVDEMLERALEEEILKELGK